MNRIVLALTILGLLELAGTCWFGWLCYRAPAIRAALAEDQPSVPDRAVDVAQLEASWRLAAYTPPHEWSLAHPRPPGPEHWNDNNWNSNWRGYR